MKFLDNVHITTLIGKILSRIYLSNWNLVSVMLEPLSCCNNVAGITFVRTKLADCVGRGRAIELLFIMRPTEAMFGLSSTFSWTHSSPMCIHLNISVIGLSLNVGSMRSEIVPSLQFFHACRNTSMWANHVTKKKKKKKIPIYPLHLTSLLT